MIEVNNLNFEFLYERARESYYKCVNAKGNDFLKEEMDMPLELMILSETSVKVVFSDHNVNSYVLEICLSLHVLNKLVGKYTHFEDEKGNIIDNALIFY